MTVKELLDALTKYPSDLLVYSEGCDCVGEAGGTRLFEDWNPETGDRTVVLVTRTDERKKA